MVDPPGRERLRTLLRESPDWERLLRIAAFNGLIPLLYWHLSTAAADLVPAGPLNRLRMSFLTNAEKALGWTSELITILRLLEEHGILAVPYKGPVLAQRVYGNLAFRQMGDLDILVERKDVLPARDLLKAAGYRSRYPLSPAGRTFLLRNRYSEIFERNSGPLVELHWAFTSVAMGFPLELVHLRPRLGELELGGSRVPVFATEDLLLILCVHGAKHCWDRLEWVSGVSDVVRREVVSWRELKNRAIQLRTERTLLLGLFLAHDILDAPIPADLIEAARSQRDVMCLAAIVRQSLAEFDPTPRTKPPEQLPRDIFRLRLQPTAHDRLRYLFHRITTPGRADTRLMVPLGEHPVPLPAFFRPFRVAGKLIKDLFKHPP